MVNTTTRYTRAIGVFKNRADVEAVIRALKDDNFDMERVSLLARNVNDVEGADEITDREGNEAREGAGIGATTGTVLGGVGGFLVGVGLLAIPGIGPVLAAGAEISAIASTLAGAGIGAAAGGIIGALVGLGIPEERAKVYEKRIKAGDYLMMVSGTEDRVRRAESIMRGHHVEDFEIYGAPDLNDANVRTPATGERATGERVDARRGTTVTSTRDLDNDGQPEIIIEDHRRETR
ncbi:MAG: CsbD family protein [Elainellaceae cyanobacterium]